MTTAAQITLIICLTVVAIIAISTFGNKNNKEDKK